MGLPSYANASQYRAAADMPSTPDADAAILRALRAGSRTVEENLVHGRRFYPATETRTMDWLEPGGFNTHPLRLWLNAGDSLNEATAVTALSIAGTAVTGYRLWPHGDPPYQAIELDLSGSETFDTGTNGYQDAVSITGTFGHNDTTEPAGELAAAVASITATTVTLSDGSKIDAGDALLVGTEWLLVTAMGWVDTAENLAAALEVDQTDTMVAVADGTAYAVGERLLVDTERMQIVDIAGNNLIVRRARDGTAMAAHSIGADIYARRVATVERGQLGSSAGTHSLADAVARLTPPAPIVSLVIAEAEVLLANESAGYGRTVGAGDNQREARGVGLAKLRKDVGEGWSPVMVYATGRGS